MAESPKSPSPSLSPCSVSRSARHARFPKGLSLSPLWRRRKERKKEEKEKKRKERASEILGGGRRQYRCSYSDTAFPCSYSVVWRPLRMRYLIVIRKEEHLCSISPSGGPHMGYATCSYIRAFAQPDIENERTRTPIEIREDAWSRVAGRRACVGGNRIRM